MIYQITRYPFEPIQFGGGLNIVAIEDRQLFFDLCQDFQLDNEKMVLSCDGSELSVEKNTIFFGDPTRIFDFNQLYLKIAIKTMLKTFDEVELKHLENFNNEINQLFIKNIFSNNLPIDLDPKFDLLNMIKSRNLTIDTPVLDTPYDKIRSTIDLASELSDPRLLIFTGAFQYLTVPQTNQLAEFSRLMERNILFLERFDSKIDLEEAANSYFFDKDFVQF